MISRRSLLSLLAALPVVRWLRPKPIVTYLGPVMCEPPKDGDEHIDIDYIYPGPGPSIQERVQRQALNIRCIDTASGRQRGGQRAPHRPL